MKKIIFMFLMLFGFAMSMNAEVQRYRTTGFAIASVNSYGTYTWGDWEDSSINIVINTDTDRIIVYSPSTQNYKVYSYDGATSDSSGGKQVVFRAYDQDGDRCTIRLRIERNGNSQIYIDFNNVAWVYNVVRTS